jgi:uncharacterized protein (UPF0303 family)
MSGITTSYLSAFKLHTHKNAVTRLILNGRAIDITFTCQQHFNLFQDGITRENVKYLSHLKHRKQESHRLH